MTMNHCRDCNSDYTAPGTCNCFAVGGKRHVATTSPAPWAPWLQPNVVTPLVPPFPGHPTTIWYGPVGATAGSTTTVSAETIEKLRANGLITYTT